MADVINKGMQKAIKIMAVTAQTARFVSLMPKPKDFVTRIVSDVVYLSAEVKKLSDDINSLLDQYANIPTNYLMVQMNSITGSLTGITNRVNTYVQTGINNVMEVGENTMGAITELTGMVIDTVGNTVDAVTTLSAAVAQSSSAVLGDNDTASEIYDTTEEIFEWNGSGFDKVSSETLTKLNNATQKITDAKTKMTTAVNDTATKVNDAIENAQNAVERKLDYLKTQMDKLSNVLDTGFGDVTGVSSIANGASAVTDALKSSDNNSSSAQAVTAISSAVSNVLKNFSISKVIKAFAGVLTQSVIVTTGLDQLPPIDFESMLANIREDMTISNEDLFKELNGIVDNTYDQIQSFNKSLENLPSEEKEYGSSKYEEFLKQYDEEINKQREEIRVSMATTSSAERQLTDTEIKAKQLLERRAMKSAIKEARKFRKQVSNARQTDKLKSVIGDELSRLKKNMEYISNSIKSDWNDMMDEYRNSIKEIKTFFQNGGDGDMFIQDCCEAINQDCKDIKSLCSNLTTQLVSSGIKVAMLSDIGAVVPNPAYKIADFWMDIKTIIKFVKDLITLVIDILNNINKLARIILNGINSLSEIIQELLEILGLKWFMDLVQTLLDLLANKITDVKALLMNMLSPVYYRDTDEYNNTLETLEDMFDENDKYTLTSSQERALFGFGNNNKRYYNIGISAIYNIKRTDDKEKAYEDLMKDLEDRADDIVAYRSPILADTETKENNVTNLISGIDLETADVKFIGWYYFHPNLDHTGLSSFWKKFKKRVISRAAKKSNTKNGGVSRLKKRKIKKQLAYDRFYWYAYYTDDLEKDCYVPSANTTGDVYIDSVTQTENGSIVHIEGLGNVFVKDNNVKSGDYVTVNGKKYRVE
jgi:hypothetical protein